MVITICHDTFAMTYAEEKSAGVSQPETAQAVL